MAAIDFNADEHEPRNSFDAIPAGKYVALVTESEEKATKAGTGSYIQFTFEILEGDHKGRKLWARLNLNNPNPTAVEIAKSDLSAMCRAAGVKVLRDTAELHDIPMVVKVTAKLDKESGELRNEIRGYEATGGTVTNGVNGASAKTIPATKPITKPVEAPWKRNK